MAGSDESMPAGKRDFRAALAKTKYDVHVLNNCLSLCVLQIAFGLMDPTIFQNKFVLCLNMCSERFILEQLYR